MNALERVTLNQIIDKAGLRYRPKCLEMIQKALEKDLGALARKGKHPSVKEVMKDIDKDLISILKRINITQRDYEQIIREVLKKLESVEPKKSIFAWLRLSHYPSGLLLNKVPFVVGVR